MEKVPEADKAGEGQGMRWMWPGVREHSFGLVKLPAAGQLPEQFADKMFEKRKLAQWYAYYHNGQRPQ